MRRSHTSPCIQLPPAVVYLVIEDGMLDRIKYNVFVSQVVRGLQPSVLPPLREAYCASLNALLRRELRAVSATQRRAGPGGDAPGGSKGVGGSPGGAGGLGPGSPLHSWRSAVGFPSDVISFHISSAALAPAALVALALDRPCTPGGVY